MLPSITQGGCYAVGGFKCLGVLEVTYNCFCRGSKEYAEQVQPSDEPNHQHSQFDLAWACCAIDSASHGFTRLFGATTKQACKFHVLKLIEWNLKKPWLKTCCNLHGMVCCFAGLLFAGYRRLALSLSKLSQCLCTDCA